MLAVPALHAYSVLSHEAIIDTVWDHEIRALLLKRFPLATDPELVHAHAHAYAGAIIQDMGYYPFGSHFFSDLLHYVRSGDFVVNLIRESQTLDEYAFALGALAHYAADTQGHAVAVNPSVALQYPHLARKYGRSVSYEDDPTAHIRVEFSFDVVQVARGNYAPQAYHDFIGFDVAGDLLERAFERTYSMKMADVFGDPDLAMATYRRAVSSIVPQMTRVAWHLKKDELKQARPAITRRRFVYNLSRAAYRKQWSGKYRGPGIGARILAFLIRILPKIGPLKALAFPTPTPRTESLFELSFDRTLDEYRRLLAAAGSGQLVLPNRDFDTGAEVRPGEYRLADNAYATLARDLAAKDPAEVEPAIRANVLEFFRDLDLQYATKRNAKLWRQTVEAVEALRAGAGKTE
ncbi:MAG: zinc dependent phospholipase C family protein [Acidobacteria bacterium]|nr:zinc dependent phospholipase C family protein [Acidobacteriota bacterium]